MQSAVATVATVLALASTVAAHGMMTCPPSRFGRGLPNNDHQRQPTVMRPSCFPSSYGPVQMLPCGGLTRDQSTVPSTKVYPGMDLHVAWEMGLWTGAALHQGWVTISLSVGGDNGPWTQLGQPISFIGLSSVDASYHYGTFKLPDNLPIGSIASLQFNWTASVTPELYYNCADLDIVKQSDYSDPPCKAATTSGLMAPTTQGYSPSSQGTYSTNAQQPVAVAAPADTQSQKQATTDTVAAGKPCDCQSQPFACVGTDTAQCDDAKKTWVISKCPTGTACDPQAFICAYTDPAGQAKSSSNGGDNSKAQTPIATKPDASQADKSGNQVNGDAANDSNAQTPIATKPDASQTDKSGNQVNGDAANDSNAQTPIAAKPDAPQTDKSGNQVNGVAANSQNYGSGDGGFTSDQGYEPSQEPPSGGNGGTYGSTVTLLVTACPTTVTTVTVTQTVTAAADDYTSRRKRDLDDL